VANSIPALSALQHKVWSLVSIDQLKYFLFERTNIAAGHDAFNIRAEVFGTFTTAEMKSFDHFNADFYHHFWLL